nr:RNA polymerase sigma factor [Sporosarcina cyprini]
MLELIMAQQDDYYRLALSYMGNAHDAMDAMEEMIVSLYANMGQLKKEEAFYSWSKTILVNRCKQMLKKQQKVVLIDEWEPASADVHNPYEQKEQHMELQEMLLLVNDYQKEAIELKYFHDLDYETIAGMTNVSIGTVKSRIFQGLKKIRDQYRGETHE